MDTAIWTYSTKTPWIDTTGHNILQCDKSSNLNKIFWDNEVRFNIGQYCEGQLWHISKVHGGDCDWATLDQWAEDHKEHIDNIIVGAQLFTWTANLTNTLVSAIFSWNQVFTSNAPQVTQDASNSSATRRTSSSQDT